MIAIIDNHFYKYKTYIHSRLCLNAFNEKVSMYVARNRKIYGTCYKTSQKYRKLTTLK